MDKRVDVFINHFIIGNSHMWFLFMIVGLYMIIPLIEPIVQNENRTRYFLMLFFVFAITIPQIISFAGIKFAGYAKLLNEDYSNINICFVLGYTGYFILGYYIDKCLIRQKQRIIVWILCVLGLLSTVLLTQIVSHYYNKPYGEGYNVFSVNVFFYIIGVFVLFKCIIEKKNFGKITKAIISQLSKYSFGAYLVHMLILSLIFDLFKIDSLTLPPIFMIPILTVVVSIVSFFISFLISKIPIINKYIV